MNSLHLERWNLTMGGERIEDISGEKGHNSDTLGEGPSPARLPEREG